MKRLATLFKKVHVSILLNIFVTAFVCGSDRASHTKAVIIEKIVDLNNSFPAPTNLPASPDTQTCLRTHQGLYNEAD